LSSVAAISARSSLRPSNPRQLQLLAKRFLKQLALPLRQPQQHLAHLR
jgi:hypothetical protein